MKKVMTVCGEIPLVQLGVTLPHEHIVCDIARLSGTPDNLLDDLEVCKQEVAYFKRARGGMIVDVTTPDIGRNAAALREISEATGIHILTCTGYYLEQTMRTAWGRSLGTGETVMPLYVKDRMGIESGTVVMLDIMVMAGGALAGLFLGWVADRVGSRPVLMPATVLTLLIPLGWLLLPRQIPHAVPWCTTLYLLYGVASSGMGIAASRLLFNGVIPAECSTAYTAIYYAWMGVTGGIAPLLAGALLSTSGNWQIRMSALVIDGHSLLFLLALLLLAAGWWLYGRVRPDDRHTTRTVARQLIGLVFSHWDSEHKTA